MENTILFCVFEFAFSILWPLKLAWFSLCHFHFKICSNLAEESLDGSGTLNLAKSVYLNSWILFFFFVLHAFWLSKAASVGATFLLILCQWGGGRTRNDCPGFRRHGEALSVLEMVWIFSRIPNLDPFQNIFGPTWTSWRLRMNEA